MWWTVNSRVYKEQSTLFHAIKESICKETVNVFSCVLRSIIKRCTTCSEDGNQLYEIRYVQVHWMNRLFKFMAGALTLILRCSCTGTVWFYTSTSNKRAARPKLYTKSLTRDLKRMYSRLTLVRISINL